MSYARLYDHVVWATKDRQPWLDAEVSRIVDVSVRSACRDVDVQLFAIGMMPEHVHVAVSIPPKLAVATVIGRIKGSSSHAVGTAQPGRLEPFAWQTEYGALSFGQRALADVVAYVRAQPRRHVARDLIGARERWTDDT